MWNEHDASSNNFEMRTKTPLSSVQYQRKANKYEKKTHVEKDLWAEKKGMIDLHIFFRN